MRLYFTPPLRWKSNTTVVSPACTPLQAPLHIAAPECRNLIFIVLLWYRICIFKIGSSFCSKECVRTCASWPFVPLKVERYSNWFPLGVTLSIHSLCHSVQSEVLYWNLGTSLRQAPPIESAQADHILQSAYKNWVPMYYWRRARPASIRVLQRWTDSSISNMLRTTQRYLRRSSHRAQRLDKPGSNPSSPDVIIDVEKQWGIPSESLVRTSSKCHGSLRSSSEQPSREHSCEERYHHVTNGKKDG